MIDVEHNKKTLTLRVQMLKSNLCDCNDADIIEKGTITVVGEGAIDAAITEDKSRKQVIFKNCDYLLTVSVKK